jgi:hypothetical protein
MRRQGYGDQPALAAPQVDVLAQSEGTDSSEVAGRTTVPATPNASATLTPRVTPIPRVTVIPPSDLSPRATLSPPADPTSPAVPTASATPTVSAPTGGSALKSCNELKAEIGAKLDAKSITGYTLTIMASGDLQGLHVVGSCEGNTKKIVLNRWRNAP